MIRTKSFNSNNYLRIAVGTVIAVAFTGTNLFFDLAFLVYFVWQHFYFVEESKLVWRTSRAYVACWITVIVCAHFFTQVLGTKHDYYDFVFLVCVAPGIGLIVWMNVFIAPALDSQRRTFEDRHDPDSSGGMGP